MSLQNMQNGSLELLLTTKETHRNYLKERRRRSFEGSAHQKNEN